MTGRDDPHSSSSFICACGCAGNSDAHVNHTRDAPSDPDRIGGIIETTVLKALVPNSLQRRAFLKAVGASTAMAAIAHYFPLAAGKAIAAEGNKPEKTKLNVGFVPITCTVPLLLAHAMGEYQSEGLDVALARTPGWALVRDKLINNEFDATHLVLAMPMTMTMGIGSVPTNTMSQPFRT